MQEFFIKQGSVNPYICMELIKDGGLDFQRSLINEALQDSVVTFFMMDENTGVYRISNGKSEIVLADNKGCEEKYILQYKWKERDTKKSGVFKAWFEINFNGNLTSEDIDYPKGKLIVPIEEDLRIVIK